jgi:putative secretion ATPase (PEP-CTERM system associated)
MYERFYNLRERPFSLSPDPDYLYPSRVHSEALSYLRYGIEGHAGFVVITGEIGCGKTTLLQTMLRGLDRQTSVSRLVNTMLDARELVEAVMLDFGLDPGQGRSKPHLLRDLARYLVDQRTAGRLTLLVIDEAQNLSLAALEEVRMLSNLETEKSKLIQIILVGQPNLRDLLARPELEQLRQRVTVRYHIQPLDAEETAAYINHRLRRAALGAPLEFSRDVTDLIHLHSQGIPRKINVIADAVLLFGYGEERRGIDIDLTHEVVDELESTGVIATPSTTAPAGAGAAAAVPAVPAASRGAEPRELAAREARVVAREKQLAEQQRVLMEGYRLLREVRQPPPASELAGSVKPAWPPPPRPPAPSPRPPAPPPSPSAAVARAAPPRAATPISSPATPMHRRASDGVRTNPDGMWTRLRRGLFGMVKPVFED